MTVKLESPSSRHSLSANREYAVIGIEADDYRILNDKGSEAIPEFWAFINRLAAAAA
jgi:hypothetical protein